MSKKCLTDEDVKKAEEEEKKKNGARFNIPLNLWSKCPKCSNLNYRRELETKNKCPNCDYVFPYPVKKAYKIEDLRAANPTWGELSEAILKELETINDPAQRIAFMAKVLGIVASYHERDIYFRRRKNNKQC